MPRLSERINQHAHPDWLRRHPRLMDVIFWWFALVYQRVGTVRRGLGRLLPKGKSFTLIDAGCGEGLFLFWLARRYPQARLIGLDCNTRNVAFAKRYAEACGFPRVEVARADLSRQAWPVTADYALCVGVLHCVADDLGFLKNLARSTTPDGKLLLYSPLRPHRFWPFFEKWYRRWHHYEARHGRHSYSPAELRALLAQAGWQVECWQGAMHRLATAGFELYTLCFLGALHARHWWASAILAALVLPAAALAAFLNRLDRLFPGSHPNGVWLTARKAAAADHRKKSSI